MSRRVHVYNTGRIELGGQLARCHYTQEAREDIASGLMKFHGVNLHEEIAKALVAELDVQFSLTPDEKTLAYTDILKAITD